MSENNREDGSSTEDQHVDPTAPPPYPQEYGAPPPPPPQGAATFGTPPPPPPLSPYATPGQGTPPSPDESASPYGGSPYGGSPASGSPSGAAPYGMPASPYGTPPPAYYQSAAPQSNTSALVLTIVSAIGTLSCCLPLPALILGIMALTKQSTEPEQSAKLAKYGWITFGVMVALAVIAFIAFMGFFFVSSSTTTSDF